MVKTLGLDAETEELQKRVNQLGAVRNKLMQELDLQVEETERLATENASITQANPSFSKSLNKKLLDVYQVLKSSHVHWASPVQRFDKILSKDRLWYHVFQILEPKQMCCCFNGLSSLENT